MSLVRSDNWADMNSYRIQLRGRTSKFDVKMIQHCQIIALLNVVVAYRYDRNDIIHRNLTMISDDNIIEFARKCRADAPIQEQFDWSTFIKTLDVSNAKDHTTQKNIFRLIPVVGKLLHCEWQHNTGLVNEYMYHLWNVLIGKVFRQFKKTIW